MAERPDYNQLSAIQGLDGATLRIIAVDGSGNILGLLQGDYMGAVKTLAVDAQGHMLAVLTDPEDVFGNPHYMGAAELAVRLGSIVNFDRQGQVIMMEDFESGIQKWEADYSVGSSVGHSTLTALSGAFSCLLYVDNVAAHYASIQRGSPYPPHLTRLGAEFSLALSGGTSDIELRLTIYTGAYLVTAALKYDCVAKKLYYLDSTLAWVEIASQQIYWGIITLWNRVKLVIDLDVGKYVKVLLNDLEYDLSAITLRSTVSVLPAILACTIKCTRNNFNASLYVDDVVLTQGEP